MLSTQVSSFDGSFMSLENPLKTHLVLHLEGEQAAEKEIRIRQYSIPATRYYPPTSNIYYYLLQPKPYIDAQGALYMR